MPDCSMAWANGIISRGIRLRALEEALSCPQRLGGVCI